MKYVLLADIHITTTNPVCRKDDVTVVQWEKLRFIFDFAREKEAAVIIAGDIFDGPRSWYVVVALMDFLDEYSDVLVFAVYGQHDMYYYSEKTNSATTLGVLIKAKKVRLLGPEVTLVDGWDWYGCSYTQTVPRPKDNERNKGLAIHAPIAKKALWPGQSYIDATLFSEKYAEYDLIVCGDIHSQFSLEVGGNYIVNSGPMTRQKATEEMLVHKPMFHFWEDGLLDALPLMDVVIPHTESNICMSREHIVSAKEISGVLDDFISSVEEISVEGRPELRELVYLFIQENEIDPVVVDILAKTMEATDG